MLLSTTRVTLADGTRVPIQDVLPGDEVVTIDGRRATVKRTTAMLYSGELIRFGVDGGFRSVVGTPAQLVCVVGRNTPFAFIAALKPDDVLVDENWFGNRPAPTGLVQVETIEKVQDKVYGKQAIVCDIELRGGESFFAEGIGMGAELEKEVEEG